MEERLANNAHSKTALFAEISRARSHCRSHFPTIPTSGLGDMLNHVRAITVLPVVQGFSVELEFDDIKPFTKVSFEPYIAEHVMADAVNLRCSRSSPQIQLLKSRF